jgi:hypothetical protein
MGGACERRHTFNVIRPLPGRRPGTCLAGGVHRKSRNTRRSNDSAVNLPRVIVTVLAAVALIGIAYGFSCFVDKVQTWASYNVSVQHVVQ